MKKFRNYLTAVAAPVILVLALSIMSGESKSSANNIVPTVSTVGGLDGISYLVSVTQLKAQNANDEALQGASKQRRLVKQMENNREKAREQTVLLQLEANARRNGEILASVKLLATELKKLDCKCEESPKR